MKKYTVISLLIIIIFLYSCNTNQSKKKGYIPYDYKNKEVEQSIESIYYDDGSLKAVIPILNGSINGLSKEFYKNGKLKEIRRYVNNSLHGVTYQYEKDGSIIKSEELYLTNKLIVKGIVGNIFDRDSLYGLTYYYPEYLNSRSDFVPVGSVFYNMNGTLDRITTNYYRVVAKDTITYGEKYDLKIDLNIGIVKNLSFKLTLGELDTLLNFTSPESVIEYQSTKNQIEIPIENYSIGSNLILGKLFIYRDGLEVLKEGYLHPTIKYLIFYHQFFVEKNDKLIPVIK